MNRLQTQRQALREAVGGVPDEQRRNSGEDALDEGVAEPGEVVMGRWEQRGKDIGKDRM